MTAFSIVDFPPVSHCSDNESVTVLVEDDTPVADAKPQTVSIFEAFHITVPGFGETNQLLVETTTNVRR